MDQLHGSTVSVRNAKRRSGERLAQEGTRLFLIEALLVSLLLVSAYVTWTYTVSALSLFFSMDEGAQTALGLVCFAGWYLLTEFVTAPTLLGLFLLSWRIVRRETVVLADLFFFWTSRARYRRALLLTRGTVFLIMAAIAAVSVTVGFFSAKPQSIGVSLLCGAAIILEIFGVLLLILWRFPLFHAAVRYEEMPMGALKEHVRRSFPHPVKNALRYLFSFAAWLLLGFLTIGVLWLADTFPRMLLTYHLYCDAGLAVYEKESSASGPSPDCP